MRCLLVRIPSLKLGTSLSKRGVAHSWDDNVCRAATDDCPVIVSGQPRGDCPYSFIPALCNAQKGGQQFPPPF
jgi:hypothetical protein